MDRFDLIPLLQVKDMTVSSRFYIDGLGFALKDEWLVDGERRWCEVTRNGASLMLQQHDDPPPAECGTGVHLYIQCTDALELFREFRRRNIEPGEPFVGNRYRVTPVVDPDGYELSFESPTDAAEETRLSDLEIPD